MRKLFPCFLAIIISFTFSSCLINLGGIDGNGIIIDKTQSIGALHELEVRGAFDIILSASNQREITITADENLMDYIIVKERDGHLLIDSKSNLDPTQDIEIHLPIGKISYISNVR
jgi:hypothetical protein